MPWIWLMSAGLRGAARVRRVRRVEWGGGREWVWRLWGGRRLVSVCGGGVGLGGDVLEDVAGGTMFGVDERFGLGVAVG